uniref:cytochrome P450 2J2-like n=1 Tax=Doryrhamphus excisus TaxID=161450 RepID=UPI0025ADE881|nr:cytochrome P450 2J2-like [Doryrhamphus excisus]
MLAYSSFLGVNMWGVLLSGLALLLAVYFLNRKDPPHFPPGPPALPLIGNVFNIAIEQSHTYLTQLADIYGDVFRLSLGKEKWVFVCGWKMLKEVLITQAENFADRPHNPVLTRMYSGNTGGLLCSNGKVWRRQRHFAMATLRTFGLANGTIERSICEESRHLQEAMEKERGEPFDPVANLNSAVANIICHIVFGKRFDYGDRRLQKLHTCLAEMIYLEGSVWARLYDAFPALMKHLPGPHSTMFSHFRTLQEFITSEIKAHKLDLDPNNPQDYMDAFLMESQDQANCELGFHEDNLVLCCLDLFVAGTETVSKTLQWGLIFLIKHPQIQDKVHAEIERVIGPTRRPTMADKANMPYTNAVVHEIQRMANVVPLNGPRVATKDTQLGGYSIPKGSNVLTILTSVLFDENQWESPHTFNPGHFLDAHGNFVTRKAFLPFSAGKRVCLGESLARMELFLFLVSLLHKFTFSTLDGVDLSFEGIVGLTRTPYPFKIRAKAR